MTDAIAMLGASLRADAQALRVTSQNVANLQTPGYRREVSILQANFEPDVLAAPAAQTAVDARAGATQKSSSPWHVALEGEGYFVVATPSGEQVTRRGDFSVDASGRLVSHEGFAVLGAGGEISPPNGVPTIDPDGTIHVGDQVIDRLRRVMADARQLVPSGGTRFAPAAGTNLTDTDAGAVKQGFLEGSNVTPTDELLRLMETMRHFEMTQHFVRNANDMLANAIGTLGKT